MRFKRISATSVSLVLRSVRAAPVISSALGIYPLESDIEPQPGSDPEVLFRAAFSIILVLLGGVFAGLTIGLMGQDEVYLQVTAETGDPSERKYASRVLRLLAKGKHWVLVTLLLSNVITNETLPIVLDRLLGGGWPAVVSSTAAIVVFGEIIPQSICVRYGLPLGAYFAPFVQVLMYFLAPLGLPIAYLLDYVLGEDHGTIYKKAGLKSLVTLHQSMGIERLNEDEVTIISAVLDLKDKPISRIMTPIADVFVLSSDAVLDEKLVEQILLTGFNRIPIHAPNEPANFVGMLLVRTLITYDPEDSLPISSFSLATLPETSPDTSCLNILNYFQEGKSHMVAVSNDPGAVAGVVGVVTLEDVIEELIGEEIVDESDVYVDVHRAIRRVTPAPLLQKCIQGSHGHATAAKAATTGRSLAPGSLKPSNKASDPRATSNTKITIKRQQNLGHPSSLNTLSPYHDDSERPLSELARSPGNIVTKVNTGEHADVVSTEQAALEQNIPVKLSRYHQHSPTEQDPIIPEDEEDDARSGNAFSENVIRVNGVNKVVIQQISSDDEQ